MRGAFNLIKQMIEENWKHSKKDFGLNEINVHTALAHLKEEITELEEVVHFGSRKPQIEELADIFGICIHIACRFGADCDQMEVEVIKKLMMRFKPNWEKV